ncbi:endonuclease/exonuclease/phosphatase family protein [Niabella hibiscisoli]|uniref:endonuclease/exonuclease/phosphatase family protein n=1 Tax=Niabella hibiscisoli TaxID=1825928 RepID=UPI001F0F3335|nr:endonuclease/exonuclease/phosphatase [Niabella hibiscisoli]MCH5715817.1 endonuclease/exonuclease/phosphatase [Niabella hibiscisoli]
MKHFYLLLLFLIAGRIANAQTAYRSAIIGFYNLENLYDTIFHGSNDDVSFTPYGAKAYTSKVFQDKLAKLARVLSEIGTDINPDGPAILGVAEIENKYVLDTLLRHPLIAARGYRYVHYDSKDFRGVDVALIYNPKYFKVERSRPVFVKIPAGTKDAIYTRDVLWVKGLLDGEPIQLFVNHWPSRSGGQKRSEPARMAAAITVRNWIDSLDIIALGVKTIVMGDLNDDPIDNSITKGLKASGDSKSLKPDELYNPWIAMYKNGMGTLAYQDAWSLFDQILLSAPFLDKMKPGFFYYKHQVFKAAYMIENTGQYKGYPMRSYNGDVYRGGYSDHFPTYVVLLKR